MGNKAGYSAVILAALGLRSGQGADCYVWAEADPDVAALLRAYPDAALLRRIAEIIRGWKDEEPRALWERLRAERKARGPRGDAEGTAEFCALKRLTFATDQPTRPLGSGRFKAKGGGGVDRSPPGVGDIGDACHRLAEYTTLADGAYRKGDIDSGFKDDLATFKRGTRGKPRHVSDRLGDQFEGMAREVAGFGVRAQWSFRRGEPESGFNPGLLTDREPTEAGGNGAKARTCEQEAGLWEPAARAGGWPPVHVLPHIPTADEIAALLGTPGDLEGVVVYSDPDYRDTTGYALTCRDLIPERARGWDAYGAVVCISEAVPLPELPTWFTAEITAGRKGQKRTFSKQKLEFLTMNREPAYRVAEQAGMFGGAA
jgi:hypothetical protein